MNSKKWIFISLALVPIIYLIITLFIILENNLNNIPFRFSNSISYDAKIRFLRKNIKLLQQSSTIVIGSSMGLNNINSRILEKNHRLGKVINLSSWGLQVSEVFQLLKIISLKNKKYIIFSTQYIDFASNRKKSINSIEIHIYIYHINSIYPYYHTLKTLTSHMTDTFFYRELYKNHNRYAYLNYDEYGGVNLNFDNKSYIKKGRWSKIPKDTIDNNDFATLEKMNAYLRNKNIKLIVASVPIRQKILKYRIVKKESSLFTKKLHSLALTNNFIYINLTKSLNLSDKYFVDKFHLNYLGAKKISTSINNILKK